MRASAILVAAGSGTRLGMDVPKAFVRIAGRTLLDYSLTAIAEVGSVTEMIVAVPAGMERAARAEVARARVSLPVKLVAGGIERQDSVRNGLRVMSAESEMVIVHDAARPFAAPALFAQCLAAAGPDGGAIAAIRVADTLKRAQGDTISATVSRAELWQAQTPQVFARTILIAAHERAAREGWVATDDADLVERCGAAVRIVEGSAANLKITTPADLRMAEALAAKLFAS